MATMVVFGRLWIKVIIVIYGGKRVKKTCNLLKTLKTLIQSHDFGLNNYGVDTVN